MSDEFGAAADTAIEHAGADAAAGLGRSKGPPDTPNCLNCGTRLVGEFCHECGQSGHSIRRPFWGLMGETLETFFSIDGRVALTLPNLLLKPGKITRDYLDGKRTRFIPAFRLYVLASLIFFIIMPLVTGQGLSINVGGSGSMEEARAAVEQDYADGKITETEYNEAIAGLDQVEEMWSGGIPGLISPEQTAAQPDADGFAPPEEEWEGIMPKSAMDAVREAGEQGDEDAARFAEVASDPNRLVGPTLEWIPRLMFVMLPVYACLLALAYLWRRQFLFFDHLIVSLHFHSALFFAMSVGFLVSLLIGGWAVLALLIYSNWYLYRLLRVVYQRGRVTTVLRVLTLDSIYFVILMSALLTAVILGALSV